MPGKPQRKVVVLNASYEILGVVPIRKAMLYVIKERAEVVKFRDGETMKTSGGEFIPVPAAVRFTKMVQMTYLSKPTEWSRRKVLERDNFECCYCGGPAKTVDHVQPVSKGGKNTFMNCVSSCQPCNSKKSDRTPEEAHMIMRYQPRVVYRRESVIAAVAATGFVLEDLYSVA